MPARTTANGSTAASTINIPRPRIEEISIPIIGTEPLIVHAWSQKVKQAMLDKQMKKPVASKEAKDPQRDFEDSRYIADEGWDGFTAVGFKASLVGACRQVEGLPMTLAKRLLFVQADGRSTLHSSGLVRIHGEPRMRQDMVRLDTGVADIRFRAEYFPWKATLTIRFNAGVISAEQVTHLVILAGMSEGVGEWRPSSPKSATGNYGLWEIEE